MNKQHYTSIEQSKHLLELGLNPESADMCYDRIIGNTPGPYNEAPSIHSPSIETFMQLPCWSLGALLEVMPKETEVPFLDSNPFMGFGDNTYRCVYLNGNWESAHQELGSTPIEAAYNMVVWLLENNYIKKGE